MKKIIRKKSVSKNRKIFFLSLSVVALITAYATFRSGLLFQVVPQKADINILNAETGTVSIAIPDKADLALNTKITVPINIFSTAVTKVAAVQLEFIYDPTKLQITNVVIDPAHFPTILSAPTITSGKVSFVVGVDPSSGGKIFNPAVSFATFDLKPIATGNTEITFGNISQVATIGKPGNMLKNLNTSVISIKGSTTTNKADISGPAGTSDGKVDIYDFTPLLTAFGQTGTPAWNKADTSGATGTPDGKVDIFDITLYITNYGK